MAIDINNAYLSRNTFLLFMNAQMPVYNLNWKSITFQNGMYSYTDLDDYIHEVIKNGDVVTKDKIETYGINFTFVLLTYKVVTELKYYFQNKSECFIGVSKHRETNESTRPQAECFYCFEVFGYPDETRSTSFGNNFSQSLSNKS